MSQSPDPINQLKALCDNLERDELIIITIYKDGAGSVQVQTKSRILLAQDTFPALGGLAEATLSIRERL